MARGARYVVIGRCVKGVNVAGYIIQDLEDGSRRLVERPMIEEMALNKVIKNVAAQVYEGRVAMKGIGCKLTSLPLYSTNGEIVNTAENSMKQREEMLLSNRIMDGKSTIGYTLALWINGVKCNEKRITRDTAVRLAQQGQISNVRVQRCNGQAILRGVNCDLSKLDTINLSRTVRM